ncbi:hypothetical protein NYR55_06135 [Sphingomonas sp. BGYR3]|uniref:hypothetical protein n=1 Tax=Sphingomonas sp. BGYR3 TaxID=2975483 RepID=UPI0021A66F77|nr:hypothetical protein [Sphingomonas sp. BGYR3]MDG5488197.1 hypothetical protein [Sphingomonas sp. BGYR3]
MARTSLFEKVTLRCFCYLSLYGLVGCAAEPLCSTKVLQVARDPGSDRYASTVLRDCGATTDYATVVLVGRANERPSDAVEVFVADSDHGNAPRANAGGIWTSVVWSAPGQLSIVHEAKARVFKRIGTAKGGVISFRAGEPYLSVPPVD